jgi:two-component system OmpR family sensor kinase
MKPGSSLQKRLGLGLTLGMTLFWLGATVGAWLVVQHELDEAFDSALEETAQRILPLAVLETRDREESRPSQHIATMNVRKEYLTYVVRNGRGEILMQSHDADPSIFSTLTVEGFTSTPEYRLYGASAPNEGVSIEIAEPLAHRREAAQEALLALLLPLLALIPISLLGTWLFVRTSLRSVRAYRKAIETRGVGDLSHIQVDHLPAEIDPLAEAVNHLMERLRKALEAQRSFTANSAHELRTPLAATLAQIQRLRREAPEGPLQVRAAKIEASLHELARLSEKLMQLAKAEGGGLLSESPQNLIPLLMHVVDECNHAAGQRIQLTLPEAQQVLSVIDPDAFAILVRNLIENATKYGASDQPIEVSLSSQALLRVVNAGAVVPEAVLKRLTERFVRGASHVSGSGLGLAIALTIAEGVDATLRLVSPATGKHDGFEAIVQFVHIQ